MSTRDRGPSNDNPGGTKRQDRFPLLASGVVLPPSWALAATRELDHAFGDDRLRAHDAAQLQLRLFARALVLGHENAILLRANDEAALLLHEGRKQLVVVCPAVHHVNQRYCTADLLFG